VIMSHQTEVVATVAFVTTGVVSQRGVRPIGVTAAALAATMSRMTDVGAASETDHVVIMVTCCPLLWVPRTEACSQSVIVLLPVCIQKAICLYVTFCVTDSIAHTIQAVLIL